MSIAEKLQTVAQNQQRVYDAGRQAEYDAFWDVFQNKGEPTNYYYKFSYVGWNDENFNPKYPIICSNATTPGMALFYYNKEITDTKVPITVLGSSAQAIFCGSQALVTIRELTLNEKANLASSFNECYALKNLTIAGVIGTSVDLHWSPLTKSSIESVFAVLSDTTTGTTATFKKTAVDSAFTKDDWEGLVASKTNWTIALG